MAKVENPKLDADGYTTRDVKLTPTEGAPYGDVSLVVRRTTNRLDLERNRLIARLLARLETLDAYKPLDDLTRQYAGHFAEALVLTLWAEGLPGFDDWAVVREKAGAPDLAETFERWLDLDGPLTDAWIVAVRAVNSRVRREMDPKSGSESANGSDGGTATDS